MAVGVYIFFAIVVMVLSWISGVPAPKHAYMGKLEAWFPLVIIAISVWIVLRGFFYYGAGLFVLWGTVTLISKTVNKHRLKKLDTQIK